MCCEISEIRPPWNQHIVFIRMTELLKRYWSVTGKSENKTRLLQLLLRSPLNIFTNFRFLILPTKYEIMTQFRNKEKTISRHKSEFSEPIRGREHHLPQFNEHDNYWSRDEKWNFFQATLQTADELDKWNKLYRYEAWRWK